MYLCATVPTPHILDFTAGGYALALSHLVGDGNNAYTEAFRALSDQGVYVILNNGAFEAAMERKPLPTLAQTLRRAEAVRAREIQFLEVFNQGKGTVKIVQSWVKELDRSLRQRYQWHAIVQGGDERDYTYCFDALADIDAVAVLGLPKVITPQCFSKVCRSKDLALTRLFAASLLLQRTTKPIHLLGLDDPRELLLQRRWGDRVRSVDTSFAVSHAQAQIRYSTAQNHYPVNIPRFDFNARLSPEAFTLAQHNIRTLREWCGDPS